VLAVRDVSKRFGGLVAVSHCSLQLGAGEVLGLIGPNGSGKTTLFNVIYNLLPPDAGEVRLDGVRITGLSPHRLARLGIGRTFQEVKLFWGLPVIENLEIAALSSGLTGWHDRAAALLEWVGLAGRATAMAEELSVGQQRLVELAVSLMPDPRVLLLDEPVAGVSPASRERLGERLRQLRDAGKSILLIEHSVPFVRAVCDRVVVLDHGVTIAEGRTDDVLATDRVLDAYLGRRGP
jgi:ABC-type branched-subunit amino acid transport system ATPase component